MRQSNVAPDNLLFLFAKVRIQKGAEIFDEILTE
jgi:hypothetical protein